VAAEATRRQVSVEQRRALREAAVARAEKAPAERERLAALYTPRRIQD
jgi:hypothetical protein